MLGTGIRTPLQDPRERHLHLLFWLLALKDVVDDEFLARLHDSNLAFFLRRALASACVIVSHHQSLASSSVKYSSTTFQPATDFFRHSDEFVSCVQIVDYFI